VKLDFPKFKQNFLKLYSPQHILATILEKGTPEQIQKLEHGKTTIDREYKQIRKAEKRQELIKNAKENAALELSDGLGLL
jgi:hypothetical protein